EQAIARLGYLEKRVEQSLQQIPTILGASAAQIADSVASKAAEHLIGKFKQADAAALDAAQKYQAASDSLKRRFWLSIFAIHLGVVLPLALLFSLRSPAPMRLRKGNES
ncbi:hypothetical protein, partial [Pseudomonas lactis]